MSTSTRSTPTQSHNSFHIPQMDDNNNIIIVTLLTTTATTILLLLSLHRFYRRHQNLPPGNLGLPFIGETLHLISAYRTENPEPFIDQRVKKYGPIFTTHVFGEATVFVTDPETNRFVLMNEGKLFDCSYPGSISNLLGKHSLLLMKGSLHKKMHSLVMSFGNSSFIRDHLLVDIDRLVRLNMMAWSDKVLLMEEAKKITFELTMKQLLSLDPCEWTEGLRKEYVLVIDGFFSLPISFFSPTYRRAIKARTKVAEALGLIVKQRRIEKEGGMKKDDMLGALFSCKEEFSDEQIVDFLLSLLVAGYETTSTTMTLAVKFLTDTPSALAQLKEEHEAIRMKKSSSDALDWSDYKSMPFTQCVINETLRVANIVGGIFRHTTEDINVKGYTIPKGFKVFAAFRGVHLDQDLYKDARTFNPWRWQSNSGPTNAFTPFGGGPRLCPGYELARVSLSVFLHRMVTNFSWTPAEDDKLVFFPTTRTQKRYPIILKRKETSEVR